MRKRLTGIIVLLLIGTLLLTGCDMLDKKDGGSNGTKASDNAGDSGKASDTPKDDLPDNKVSEAPPPEETPSAAASTLARGVWDSNNVYTSEYASVTFAMPGEWVYGTDEEIANMMNVGMDVMSEAGMNFSKEMLAQQSIYDMMASNPLTGSSVMLMYDNLSMIVGGSQLSAEQYLESLRMQLGQAASAGLVYTTADEIVDYTLCGQDYEVLATEIADYGIEQYYFVRKIDNYIVGIIISVTSSDDIDTILEYFI